MNSDIRNFSAKRDRLFLSIVDLSVIIEAIYSHLMVRSDQPLIPPRSWIALTPAHCTKLLALPVSANFPDVAMFDKIERISIKFVNPPRDIDMVAVEKGPGSLSRSLNRMVASIYLRFYETYRPWWVERFNRDEATWPPIMRFARIVRNAAGHQMRIDWNSQNVAAVNWRGLTYSHADNGREIIGGDLVAADILFLMLDLSDELDTLGCPFEP
ncbi:MAG: hypothetical protein RIA09_04505 [Hoeflea sp.]|uniref:hypothetical protein n=1 Tax=Hoeflea sp. TaxID=1940281 RepID=UPI0032F06311